jgi:hypothetical protein
MVYEYNSKRRIIIEHDCMGDGKYCSLIEELRPILKQHSARIVEVESHLKTEKK